MFVGPMFAATLLEGQGLFRWLGSAVMCDIVLTGCYSIGPGLPTHYVKWSRWMSGIVLMVMYYCLLIILDGNVLLCLLCRLVCHSISTSSHLPPTFPLFPFLPCS